MMRLIFSAIILLNFSILYSQDLLKYKVISIDSLTLQKYYIVKVKGKDKRTNCILSKKTEKTEENERNSHIKIGYSYCFKLEFLDKDSVMGETPNPRGLFSYYVEGKKVLDANEYPYTTQCLIGLKYDSKCFKFGKSKCGCLDY